MRRLIWLWRSLWWPDYTTDLSFVFGMPTPPEPGPCTFRCPSKGCRYKMTGAWSREDLRPVVLSHFREHATRKVQR